MMSLYNSLFGSYTVPWALILKAVSLFFVHILKIRLISLQIIKQKLGQHYETHIQAQSCKASRHLDLFIIYHLTNTMLRISRETLVDLDIP